MKAHCITVSPCGIFKLMLKSEYAQVYLNKEMKKRLEFLIAKTKLEPGTIIRNLFSAILQVTHDKTIVTKLKQLIKEQTI